MMPEDDIGQSKNTMLSLVFPQGIILKFIKLWEDVLSMSYYLGILLDNKIKPTKG